MKKLFLAPLFFLPFLLFAANPADNVFPANDAFIKDGKCEWKCRNVNSNYATQIVGFDFANGTTFCRVYEKNDLDLDLKFSANQTNLQCVKDMKNGLDAELQGFKTLINQQKSSLESKIAYTQSDKQIPMSQFLSSLVTLNPNIIDREQTSQLGTLVLKNGLSVASIEKIRRSGWQRPNVDDTFYNAEQEGYAVDGVDYEQTSAADGFNKANMAYFSDLFMNMEKVYQHLQILLFVIVGGFYITTIGANKLQIYLENRGESAGNQPYLHKFYIPLLMVGTFFMPIPEANGTAHSTVVQNLIRYFTTQSTQIADLASAIGAKTYMDKIYKSVGGVSEGGILALLNQKYEKRYIATKGEEIYAKTCQKRYTKAFALQDETYFVNLSEEEKRKFRDIHRIDINQVAGSQNDISLEACVFLEIEIQRANKNINLVNTHLDGIRDFYTNGKVKDKLGSLDLYFAMRENQLGWVSSLITPTSAILADTFVFADDKVIKYDIEASSVKNRENLVEYSKRGAITNKDNESQINDSLLGMIAGKLVWMMMPGASDIKNFIQENVSKVFDILAGAFARIPGIGTILSSIIGGALGSIASTVISYIGTVVLLEWTFEKIPLLVCATAGIIAFVSYLVGLCKYFYISPFVVCFSLATRRMNKIIDFLISGIAIFCKPVLIVLFIYLALFVHTLINEIFVFISIEQFAGITTSVINFHTNFVIGAITGMLKIFGILSSSYIMWKLIISGPSWALSLVGIDGKQDDVIAQGIEANLARRAFVV